MENEGLGFVGANDEMCFATAIQGGASLDTRERSVEGEHPGYRGCGLWIPPALRCMTRGLDAEGGVEEGDVRTRQSAVDTSQARTDDFGLGKAH